MTAMRWNLNVVLIYVSLQLKVLKGFSVVIFMRGIVQFIQFKCGYV